MRPRWMWLALGGLLLSPMPGSAQRSLSRQDTLGALTGLLPAIGRSVEAYAGPGSLRGRVVQVNDSLHAIALRRVAERLGFRVVVERDTPARCAPMRSNSARSSVPIGVDLNVEFKSFDDDRVTAIITASCTHHYVTGPGDPYFYGQEVVLRRRGARWRIERVRNEWVT